MGIYKDKLTQNNCVTGKQKCHVRNQALPQEQHLKLTDGYIKQ